MTSSRTIQRKKKRRKKKSLNEQLRAWRNAGEIAKVSQARDYLYDRDPKVRKFVSLELGKLVAARPVNDQVQQAMQMLGQLSRDPEASVRQAAVKALGTIPSQRVIPFLQRALRDADAEVVKTASAALERYKFYPTRRPQPKAVQKPKR